MHRALLALLAACGARGGAERVPIDTADALWSGDGAFCARTGSGLGCWTSSRAPTIVTGLKNVTQVAIVGTEGCALHDGDVTCFVPGEAESRGRPFDQPTQLSVSGAEICVQHASGRACWKPPRAPPSSFTCTLAASGDVTCTRE